MKNEKGFTLVEMLVVLLIISILVLITIPNVSKHFASVDDKGCEAYLKMVQGQVDAYKVDYLYFPTAEQLVEAEYLKELPKCPNGNEVEIDNQLGRVKEKYNVIDQPPANGSGQ